jgi:hypothetical protein
MRKKTAGALTIAGTESADLKSGVKLFIDRDYLSASLPDALKNAHFLLVAMNGKKTISSLPNCSHKPVPKVAEVPVST